jgi:hypothetical protein
VTFLTPEFSFIKFPLEFSNASSEARDRRTIGKRAEPQQTAKAHQSRRTTMLRKLIIGLVAAASLSTLVLAPTAASAKWGGGGGGGWGGGWGHHHHHFGGGIRFVGGGFGGGFEEGCYVTRRVLTPYGYRLRTINVCGY